MSVAHAAAKSYKPPNARLDAFRERSRFLPRTLSARSRPGDTTLQRHASFFDDNGDRVIGIVECARGLEALGLAAGVAGVFAIAIVVPLGMQTRGSLAAMSIDVENIHKGKHDSDTGILDKRGRFNAKRFEQVFGARSSTDRDGDRVFVATEISRMVSANRQTLLGFVVACAEWRLLLLLAADSEGIEGGKLVPALSVARIKSFYDGTLFYKLARERARNNPRSPRLQASGRRPGARATDKGKLR